MNIEQASDWLTVLGREASMSNVPLSLSTYLGARNRGQRVATQIEIDLSSRKVVHNNDIMTLVTQIERSRPSYRPTDYRHQMKA